MPNRIERLYERGQSVWCDNLSRAMIDAPETARPTDSLRKLIQLGVVGITSNPTIFRKAITYGHGYDDRLRGLSAEHKEADALYEALVIPDIQDAADMLKPVFDRTRGVDGFVSLEVNPHLAYDTEGTIREARRLSAAVARPNVFIKVPATDQGIPAIESLIGEGIHVNVTLIFSLTMYERVMEAYLGGLQRLANCGKDVSKVASVASFFVSRVDTAVDKLLMQKESAAAKELLGRTAIANAKLAYSRFEQVFAQSGSFGELSVRGARAQRPLWASTSTKNPAYSDTMYVDELVGPDTVNTMPPETLAAVLDHGRSEATIRDDLADSRAVLAQLTSLGIDLEGVTKRLTTEGVDAFAKSYDELRAGLENTASRT